VKGDSSMKRTLILILACLACAGTAFGQEGSSATIWFYRPARATGASRMIFQVRGATERVASISAGEFFGLRVPAGVHVFSYLQAQARGQSVTVRVADGQQVYVEVQFDSIAIVPEDRGIQSIQTAQAIPVTNAASDAVIFTAARPVTSTTAPTPITRQVAPPPQGPSVPDPNPARRSSAPSEFRRFEILFLPFSYQRQGNLKVFGGSLALTVKETESFGIVVDFGVHEQTFSGVDARITTYRFGPKFSGRAGDRVTIFGQVLAGGAHLRGDVAAAFGGGSANVGLTGSGVSILGGGGLDIGIRPWFAIRVVEGGYSGLYFSQMGSADGGWSNGMRVSAGVVFRFGKG
jgi:hypothetical protein